MRLVISAIKILSIPAGREENLRSETVRTIDGGETACLWVSGILVVIETIVADGLGSKIVGRRSLERITSNHSETFGEGLQLVIVRTRSLQVIDEASTDLVDFLEGTILVLVVQGWSPVIGEITMNCARGTCRGLGIGVVHLKIETVATHDLVNVARHIAWIHDGIRSFDNKSRFAW